MCVCVLCAETEQLSRLAPSDCPHLLLQAVAGPMAAATASTLTNPMDVVRARVQVNELAFTAALYLFTSVFMCYIMRSNGKRLLLKRGEIPKEVKPFGKVPSETGKMRSEVQGRGRKANMEPETSETEPWPSTSPFPP